MKKFSQGLLVISYAALSSATMLRAAQQAAVTTPAPLVTAVVETERYLNKTVNRFSAELKTISAQLVSMNQTLNGWGFNMKVLEDRIKKDDYYVNNNTKLIDDTTKSSGLKTVVAKAKTVHDKVVAFNVTKNKLQDAILNGGSTGGKKGSSEKTMDLIKRINKAKRMYLLNGTKMETMLKDLKKMESTLKMNSTIVTERILRRQTDDALAEIPKELQKQLVETMKDLKKKVNKTSA